MPHESVPPSHAARRRWAPPALLLTGVLALLASAWEPHDVGTWWAETLPASLAALLLLATYRRFPLTTLTYVVIWLFALILIAGGHWTYERVPLGLWVKSAFGLARNHYDRLGHFFQGVTPALVARELLVRTSPLRPGAWLATCCVSLALAISAAYELVEWWFAETFGGAAAVNFLGSQGDVWDAQQDMLMALLGAVVGLLLLGRWQQRQIESLPRA